MGKRSKRGKRQVAGAGTDAGFDGDGGGKGHEGTGGEDGEGKDGDMNQHPDPSPSSSASASFSAQQKELAGTLHPIVGDERDVVLKLWQRMTKAEARDTVALDEALLYRTARRMLQDAGHAEQSVESVMAPTADRVLEVQGHVARALAMNQGMLCLPPDVDLTYLVILSCVEEKLRKKLALQNAYSWFACAALYASWRSGTYLSWLLLGLQAFVYTSKAVAPVLRLLRQVVDAMCSSERSALIVAKARGYAASVVVLVSMRDNPWFEMAFGLVVGPMFLVWLEGVPSLADNPTYRTLNALTQPLFRYGLAFTILVQQYTSVSTIVVVGAIVTPELPVVAGLVVILLFVTGVCLKLPDLLLPTGWLQALRNLHGDRPFVFGTGVAVCGSLMFWWLWDFPEPFGLGLRLVLLYLVWLAFPERFQLLLVTIITAVVLQSFLLFTRLYAWVRCKRYKPPTIDPDDAGSGAAGADSTTSPPES